MKKQKRRGRASVLALRAEIVAALIAGKTTQEVFEDVQDRVSVKWRQFYRYVNELKEDEGLHGPGVASPNRADNQRRVSEQKFVHTAKPKKDELI